MPPSSPIVPRDLFIYVDESGDFNFSPKGTACYYLTAVSTFLPSYGLLAWHAIKHAAITAGVSLEELHASEDKQWIRDQVFGLLAGATSSLRVDGIAVEKAKTHPGLRAGDGFYRRMMEYLLRYVVNGRRRSFDRLYIFLDTIPVAKKRKEIIGGLKKALAATLPGVPYYVEERDSRGEHLLQMADYCCWALYVARAKREMRPRTAIAPLIASAFKRIQAWDRQVLLVAGGTIAP